MKKILCFDDSNTYGFIPGIGGRYPQNVRWTGFLQELYHQEIDIIEAGCNNRTGFMPNPEGEKQTGYKALPRELNGDFDLIILSIGINDLQTQYNVSMPVLRQGLEGLIETCRKNCPQAQILIMAPPHLRPNVLNCLFSCMFDKNSIEKSKKLAALYEQVAQEKHCEFLNLEGIAEVSAIDGLHYTAKGHNSVAKAVFNKIQMRT